MSTSCLIISGGEFAPIEKPADGVFVIACDRGYTYALRCGIRPDLLISDFDSYDGEVAPDIPIQRFSSIKDDTDTMLALRWAIKQGFTEAEIVCALGGRLDHSLANLQSLSFAAMHGLNARITSPDTSVRVLRGGNTLRLPQRKGFALSLFSAGEPCRGLTIRGTKYDLSDAELDAGFPLGVSNDWRAAEAEISLREGLLWILESKKE